MIATDKGITLLEVLLAVTVLGVVAAMLSLSLGGTLRVVAPLDDSPAAPAPLTDATLKENACGEPICGVPKRLNRIRNMACASVAVPTVDRTLAPMRSWSTMIAVVRPSSTSTSGRAIDGMNPCTNAL